MQFLKEVSELIRVDYMLKVPMRDPKDVVVLQTAVAGEADVLCTLDRDFYAPNTLEFCAVLDIKICNDLEFLQKIKP